MSTFKPCQGKDSCRDNGKFCLTCGRSLAEIEQTRKLIDELAVFVCAQGYDNVSEFTTYVADKIEKKVRHRRETN
jgi:hypothetical protein